MKTIFFLHFFKSQMQNWKHRISYTQEQHTNINSFVYAGIAVYVDVTEALTVAQYRNALSCPLNVPDQLGRAPWNDQVDQLVESAQILNFFTCAHLNKATFAYHRICDLIL